MPELSDLQSEVLSALKNNSADNIFGIKESTISNEQLYNLIKNKPSDLSYFSRVLQSLEKKGKIKIKSVYETGASGKLRTITIL